MSLIFRDKTFKRDHVDTNGLYWSSTVFGSSLIISYRVACRSTYNGVNVEFSFKHFVTVKPLRTAGIPSWVNHSTYSVSFLRAFHASVTHWRENNRAPNEVTAVGWLQHFCLLTFCPHCPFFFFFFLVVDDLRRLISLARQHAMRLYKFLIAFRFEAVKGTKKKWNVEWAYLML
jgi:hypothetical protein